MKHVSMLRYRGNKYIMLQLVAIEGAGRVVLEDVTGKWFTNGGLKFFFHDFIVWWEISYVFSRRPSTTSSGHQSHRSGGDDCGTSNFAMPMLNHPDPPIISFPPETLRQKAFARLKLFNLTLNQCKWVIFSLFNY